MLNQNVSELQDLLSTLLKALVTRPEEIKIEAEDNGRLIKLVVHSHPSDLGKIIGRGGKRATAIRTLMKAKATQMACRVIVDIKD